MNLKNVERRALLFVTGLSTKPVTLANISNKPTEFLKILQTDHNVNEPTLIILD